MKILSIRTGFLADHSSTSYDFLAVDRTLTASERSAVSRLSSRVRPTARRAHFIYHGDWSDLPGGWEPLVAKYYDVMYSESYGWWTLAFAFHCQAKTFLKHLQGFDFEGEDGLGIKVKVRKARVVVSIHCQLEPGGYGDDFESWDEDTENEEDNIDNIARSDSLMHLLVEIRRAVMEGDFRPLKAVWVRYADDEQECPSSIKKTKMGAVAAKALSAILEGS